MFSNSMMHAASNKIFISIFGEERKAVKCHSCPWLILLPLSLFSFFFPVLAHGAGFCQWRPIGEAPGDQEGEVC